MFLFLSPDSDALLLEVGVVEASAVGADVPPPAALLRDGYGHLEKTAIQVVCPSLNSVCNYSALADF